MSRLLLVVTALTGLQENTASVSPLVKIKIEKKNLSLSSDWSMLGHVTWILSSDWSMQGHVT